MIEELIDVVGHFVIVECTFGQSDAFAFEFTVVTVGTAVHDYLFEPIVEPDVLFVGLESFDFQLAFADELASKSGRECGTLTFVADHDDLAAVLEQSTHRIAQVSERVIDQDKVDRTSAAISVEILQFTDQILAEGVVELLGAVSVLVDVDLLFKHKYRLHCDFDRASVRRMGRLSFAAYRT